MNESNHAEVERIFYEIKSHLPERWGELEDRLKIHHLMLATSEVLKPNGNWILVNGDLTLLQILGEKAL